MPRIAHRIAVVTASLGLAAALGACGGDNGGDNGAGSAPSSSAPSASAPSSAAASTLGTATTSLGTVLVDGAGKTLYLFTKDTGSTSTCKGECLAKWPAFTGPATAGADVDASLIGTTTRDDGTVQVTYAGHPLYYFAQDAAAGETKGQEVGDVWYVVDAKGNAVEK